METWEFIAITWIPFGILAAVLFEILALRVLGNSVKEWYLHGSRKSWYRVVLALSGWLTPVVLFGVFLWAILLGTFFFIANFGSFLKYLGFKTQG